MKFDFNTFSKIAYWAYRELKQADLMIFSFDECLNIFYEYFSMYEEKQKKAHPHIRKDQIKQIIKAMPECDDFEIYADDYESIIKQHFATEYRNCDYNINHFFSGVIRLLRFYEVCYYE